jgi:hypothetical protein
MLRPAISTVCAVLILASVANADVYKYTDEKGNVQYTDRPLTLPAQRLSVSSQRTDVVAIDERVGEDTKAISDREKARQQADKAKAEQQNAAENAAAAKADACVKARTDYLGRMGAQRIWEPQANGERRYLTDAEVEASRASAKQAMDTLCN